MRFPMFGCGVVALGAALGAIGQQVQAAEPAAMPPLTAQARCFVVPNSGTDKPNHTNYRILSLDCKTPLVLTQPIEIRSPGPVKLIEDENSPGVSASVPTYSTIEIPQSLGCIYVNSPSSPGCVPSMAGSYPPGAGSGGPSPAGYGVIVIVDAYDNPDAATDLSTFDSYWDLKAPPSFTKVYATGGSASCTTVPPAPIQVIGGVKQAGWAFEESLDIEWAHVFAANAAIVLVEACSASNADLFYAEEVAFNYIVKNYPSTGGQVSNSWGGDEFTGFVSETAFDPLFASFNYSASTPITAFAASGDCGYLNTAPDTNCGSETPGINNYPSVNPWVVSAGGTVVLRNDTPGAAFGHFVSEECWDHSGGGPSAYENWFPAAPNVAMGPWADYQYPLFAGNNPNRHTPDMSFDSDAVYIYSQYGLGGWSGVVGTSIASPALAGIVNRAGNRMGTRALQVQAGAYFAWENNLIYSQLASSVMYKNNFYDVKTGSNFGPGASVGYDECTGVGSPRGLSGK